jgi:hypothetical protein
MPGVLFSASDPQALPVGHAGFLAGRYRDGAYSDEWTDVLRCAEGTFVGYAPACTCGWRGHPQPANSAGRALSRREWFRHHLTEVDTTRAAESSAASPNAPSHRSASTRQPVSGR